MLNMPDDSEIATDVFRNYLLEYFEKEFVNKIVNQASRNWVNIMAPPKKTLLPPRRGAYVDRVEIENEAQLGTTLMQLDPAQKPEEYK